MDSEKEPREFLVSACLEDDDDDDLFYEMKSFL